jgi:hypothetical protein
MVNYGNGKIYKIEPICDHDENEVYIGSTTKRLLCQRMDTHRADYKLWLKGGRGKVMSFKLFDKYGVENCIITLLETARVRTKDQLKAKEVHFIQTIKCVNKHIPGRTHTEICKQYRVENREQIRAKQNVKFVCECGGRHTYVNKTVHFRSEKHQKYVNENYEWTYWWGDIQCTLEDYNICHYV